MRLVSLFRAEIDKFGDNLISEGLTVLQNLHACLLYLAEHSLVDFIWIMLDLLHRLEEYQERNGKELFGGVAHYIKSAHKTK